MFVCGHTLTERHTRQMKLILDAILTAALSSAIYTFFIPAALTLGNYPLFLALAAGWPVLATLVLVARNPQIVGAGK